jgi:alpha-galactosidase
MEQERMKDSIAPRPDEMAAAASWWDAHLAGDAWPFSLQLDGQRVDGPDQPFVLRSHVGNDHEFRTIYQPQEQALRGGHRFAFAPTSSCGQEEEGRPSSGAFPYFAFEEASWGRYSERPLARGFFLAVGWPGRWHAEFAQEADRLRIRAGHDGTRFRLKPGETFRATLIALCFFGGPDRVRAMNLWRRRMLAHNVPRPGGQLPPPMLEASTCGFFDEMGRADEANQIEYTDRYRAAKLPITHWWMDAGWYPCYFGPHKRNCRWIVGTWEPDRARFPRGLRAIADHAHGIQTIVWFEPERVAPGTWLARKRPQWLLFRAAPKPTGLENSWVNFQRQDENGLLDLGNRETLDWLIERVRALIQSEGIDVYRQDFRLFARNCTESSGTPQASLGLRPRPQD